VAASTLVVLAGCAALLFVLTHENSANTIVVEEVPPAGANPDLPIHGDWDDALNGGIDTSKKCAKIRDEMVEQHDRFWANVKSKLVRTYGLAKAHSVESAFTKEVDGIEASLKQHACAATATAGAKEAAQCAKLREARVAAAHGIKAKVSKLLLAKDSTFQQYLNHVSFESRHLERRLARLKCAGVLASTKVQHHLQPQSVTHHAAVKAASLVGAAQLRAAKKHAKLVKKIAHHTKKSEKARAEVTKLHDHVKKLQESLAVAKSKLDAAKAKHDAQKDAIKSDTMKAAQSKAMQATLAAKAAGAAKVENLEAQLSYHAKKIASQKSVISRDQKLLRNQLKQTQQHLAKRKSAIKKHEAKIGVLKRKIKRAKWAASLREKLAAPPSIATKMGATTKAVKKMVAKKKKTKKLVLVQKPKKASAKKKVSQADQLGSIFDADFGKPAVDTMGATTMLSVTPSLSSKFKAIAAKDKGVPKANATPASTAKAATPVSTAASSLSDSQAKKTAAKEKTAIAVDSAKKKEKAKLAKKAAKPVGATLRSTAKLTAQGVAAVKAQVHSAARAAAKAAAKQAEKLGFDVKKTKQLVRRAARAAARKAAKNSEKVYAATLKRAGVKKDPKLLAAKRLKDRVKEKSAKRVEHRERKHKRAKDFAVEAAHKKAKNDHATRVEQRAAAKLKAAVAAGIKHANPALKSAVGAEAAAFAKKIKDSNSAALHAEANAWAKTVGAGITKKKVIDQIRAYRKKHGGTTMQAAAAWEATMVAKMKSRFARDYTSAATAKTKNKRQVQVEKEKLNAFKMVIARAEMQSFLARRTEEKLTKATTRATTAASRAKAANAKVLARRLKESRLAAAQSDAVQRKAVAKVLAKDAAQTMKAQAEANRAEAEAKHAVAAKREAVTALAAARSKLETLSTAAAKGTAQLSAKLRTELKAQQEQMKLRLKAARQHTAREVKDQLKKSNSAKLKKEVAAEKARLAKISAAKTATAEARASKVATAAEEAAGHARILAKQEAKVAAHAREHSMKIAKKAQDRAAAVKAMAAKQMATLAKQKGLALKHFQQFNVRLKALQNENAAKNQAKLAAKGKQVHKATLAAARAARFAEAQMTEADLQRSQAVINKADTANAILKKAISHVNQADTLAHGTVYVEEEKQRLLAEKKHALERKEKKLALAKEKRKKIQIKAAEAKGKSKAKKMEKAKKKALKEKTAKNDRLLHEGFVKGVAHQKEISAKVAAKALAARTAKAAARAAKKGERKAKALLKKSKVPKKKAPKKKKGPMTPADQARQLVRKAVDATMGAKDENKAATADVADAEGKLRAFMNGKTANTAAKAVAAKPTEAALKAIGVHKKGKKAVKKGGKKSSKKSSTSSVVAHAVKQAVKTGNAAAATSHALKKVQGDKATEFGMVDEAAAWDSDTN
jgi:hypothetical protein